MEKDLIPTIGHLRLAEVTGRHLTAMFAELAISLDTGRPRTASTMQRIRATLRAAYNAAIRDGLRVPGRDGVCKGDESRPESRSGRSITPTPRFRNDRRWGFSSERLGIMFHGNTLTHLDSPCHIYWDGTMYNGRSHSLVDAATGAAWAAVTAAANGILTQTGRGERVG